MDKFQAFKDEVKELCKKHDLYIAHEDTQGGFIIRRSYSEENMEWFMGAMSEDETSSGRISEEEAAERLLKAIGK